MGWQNPPVPWADIEGRLSDWAARDPELGKRGRRGPDGRPDVPGDLARFANGDGGDSPAWSRKRLPYQPVPLARQGAEHVPYAELHCHSNFSFLDGASHPEELVEEAVRLGLEALALTDHNGFYGVVRFAEAARAHGLATVFGAELTLAAGEPRSGSGSRGRGPLPDPSGSHLLVLARNPAGYARLARAISAAQMAGEKAQPATSLEALASVGPGDDWLVLTGCRKGAVTRALEDDGPAAASRELARLVEVFGRANVVVELWDHGTPLDSARNDALATLAVRHDLDVVATNNVHYANPARRPLATALAAVRSRRSLDEIDGWLPAASTAHLRSGAEQARRFARYPGAVERAAELALACAFDLQLVAPKLPDFPVPPGHTEMSWLRELVERGATHHYGPRPPAPAMLVGGALVGGARGKPRKTGPIPTRAGGRGRGRPSTARCGVGAPRS